LRFFDRTANNGRNSRSRKIDGSGLRKFEAEIIDGGSDHLAGDASVLGHCLTGNTNNGMKGGKGTFVSGEVIDGRALPFP
jgi:hypothetical protein